MTAPTPRCSRENSAGYERLYCLATNHPEVSRRVREAQEIIFSTIVVGELLLGFRVGTRFEDSLHKLEAFLASRFVALFPVSLVTADRFGRIGALLRRRGTPIPTNDIWIAAQAMETGADLISFDCHFERIDGLIWTCPS